MSDDDANRLPRLSIPDEEEEERGTAETRLLAPGEILYGGRKRVPWFVVIHGARSAGRMFKLQSGMTIGRAIGSDLLLDEDGVSRRHAKLKVLSTGQVLIEDLGSSNGIYFGEERVERRVLSDGDRIRIGDVVLALLLLDAPNEAAQASLEAFDPDTRLPNRRYIMSNLAETLEYAGRYHTPVAFGLLLVDQLHEIHNTHGSGAASSVIAQVAMTARNVLQDSETCVGRFCEDELAIVLPDADSQHAARGTEWIRRAVEATLFRVATEMLKITITAGFAVKLTSESSSSLELVERARRNLCRAIVAGRNRIEPYDPLLFATARPTGAAR